MSVGDPEVSGSKIQLTITNTLTPPEENPQEPETKPDPTPEPTPEPETPTRRSSGGGGGGGSSRVVRSSRTPDSTPAPQGAVLGAERTPVPEVLGVGRLPKTGEKAQKPDALWLMVLTLLAFIGAAGMALRERQEDKK